MEGIHKRIFDHALLTFVCEFALIKRAGKSEQKGQEIRRDSYHNQYHHGFADYHTS